MTPAEKVIERFGGLTATARALSGEFPVSTVQGWRKRGRIPERYWGALVSAAALREIDLHVLDFIPEDIAEAAQ